MLGEIAGALIGGAFQLQGAREQNAANSNNARAAQEFSERMANTAHQRQVADLKAAGLNPILSVNAGASSPTGEVAQAENVMEGMAQSAREIGQMKLNAERQKEEVKLLQDQQSLTRAQAAKATTEAHVLSKGIPAADAANYLFQKGKEAPGIIQKAIEGWLQNMPRGHVDEKYLRQKLERDRERNEIKMRLQRR
jgi:hypothetical protein